MPHELSTEKLGPVTSMRALLNLWQKVGPEICKCYFKLLHGSIYYPQTSQIRKSFELMSVEKLYWQSLILDKLIQANWSGVKLHTQILADLTILPHWFFALIFRCKNKSLSRLHYITASFWCKYYSRSALIMLLELTFQRRKMGHTCIDQSVNFF